MADGQEQRGTRGSETSPRVMTYKERLDADVDWSWNECDAYFREESEVQKTLRRLAARLDELQIPYAVIGALAMKAHKYERLTIDVDMIVSRESLKKIHDELEGLGFVPPCAGSKNLRDTMNGVKIDLVVAGDFPGDGKPKPVAFPDPSRGTVEIRGIRYVTLEKLVELKLASGLADPYRLKDIAEIQELLAALKLSREFGDRLHPYVRAKYDELWVLERTNTRRDEF